MSSYSIGSILWILVCQFFANPHNLEPDTPEKFYSKDSEVVANVPSMLMAMGTISGAYYLMACILVNRRVFRGGSVRHTSVDSHTSINIGKVSPRARVMTLKQIVEKSKPPLRKLTLKQALSHRTFWHIIMMLFCSMSFCDFIKPSMKLYGSIHHSNDLFLTMVGMLAFISSSMSKFIWGVI